MIAARGAAMAGNSTSKVPRKSVCFAARLSRASRATQNLWLPARRVCRERGQSQLIQSFAEQLDQAEQAPRTGRPPDSRLSTVRLSSVGASFAVDPYRNQPSDRSSSPPDALDLLIRQTELQVSDMQDSIDKYQQMDGVKNPKGARCRYHAAWSPTLADALCRDHPQALRSVGGRAHRRRR